MTMGGIKQPASVKLLCSILAADAGLLDEAHAALIERYGPADFVSPPMPFHHTTYYAEEMGPDLQRQILAFAALADPGSLPDVKIETNALEARWMVAGRRRVNLDPGYLTLAKLVLATTKDNSHRLYLRDGIYAEITLRFRDGHFGPWEWTYPDYASAEYCALFDTLRHAFAQQLRAQTAG